jgi:hypothetical protein
MVNSTSRILYSTIYQLRVWRGTAPSFLVYWKGEGESEREGGERYDFMVLLHDKSGTGQVVALDNFMWVVRTYLPNIDQVLRKLKSKTRIKYESEG